MKGSSKMFRLIICSLLIGCGGNFDVGQEERDTGNDTGNEETTEKDGEFDRGKEDNGVMDSHVKESESSDIGYDSYDGNDVEIPKCDGGIVNACGGCGDICKWNDGTVSCKEWLALKTCSLAPAGGCIKCGGPNLLICEKC